MVQCQPTLAIFACSELYFDYVISHSLILPSHSFTHAQRLMTSHITPCIEYLMPPDVNAYFDSLTLKLDKINMFNMSCWNFVGRCLLFWTTLYLTIYLREFQTHSIYVFVESIQSIKGTTAGVECNIVSDVDRVERFRLTLRFFDDVSTAL